MDHRIENIVANLKAHAAECNVEVSQVIGLKLRAVRDPRSHSTRYLGGDVYEPLIKAFDLHPRPQSGYRGGGVHERGGATLVEHESGPELLAAVLLFGTALGPFLSIADFASKAAAMANWLRRKLREPDAGRRSSGDPQGARYIRIESRQVSPDGSLEETVVTVLDLAEQEDDERIARAVERVLTEGHMGRPKIRRGTPDTWRPLPRPTRP